MTDADNRSLLREHDFLVLVASRTVSTLAVAVTWVLLPLLVYRDTGSATLSGLMSAMQVLPFLLLGLIAGASVDRTAPRGVMVGVEVANAAVLLAVPMIALRGAVPTTALFAVGACSSGVYVWFDVASAALVPTVAGRGRVLSANGYLWSVATVVTAAAGPLGLALQGELGTGGAFAVLAIASLASAWWISRLRGDGGAGRAPAKGSATATARGAVAEGFGFLRRQPTVRALTLLSIGSGVSGGAVYGLIAVMADEALAVPTDDSRLGWLLAASSVGALAASFVAPRVRSVMLSRLLPALLGADTVLMVGYALAPGWTLAAAALLLWNLVHTTTMIVSISVRQILAPDHLQGRVNAAGRMIGWGTVPLGTAIGGVLMDAAGARAGTLVLAVPVAASLAWALVLLPALRTSAQPRPDHLTDTREHA